MFGYCLAKIARCFYPIFPPNAFSPNATNENQREFKLGSNGIATEGYHFTIISRWNDIVFEAKEEIKGWNGQMQNGSPAPAGNYVWILDFSDFLGRRHRQTGTVTLVYCCSYICGMIIALLNSLRCNSPKKKV